MNVNWVRDGKTDGINVRVEDDGIAVPARTKLKGFSPMVVLHICKEDATLISNFQVCPSTITTFNSHLCGNPNFTTSVFAHACHESHIHVVLVCVDIANIVLQGLVSFNKS